MNVQIPCICPPKGDEVRHPSGDTVTLREKLPFQAVAAIRWAVGIQKTTDPRASIADTFGLLTEHYVMAGVEAWTVVGDNNKPIEVTPDALRDVLLAQIDAAITVADKADDLYQAVMLPLLLGSSTSSPSTPTTGSTSRTTGRSARHPKRSKPSSTTTTRTDGTETTSTSLALVSSSSQSSESAA